jgi:hypothetical protein
VREFALRKPMLFPQRPKPGRPNLNIHFGIITPTGIFVKTCLQSRLTERCGRARALRASSSSAA